MKKFTEPIEASNFVHKHFDLARPIPAGVSTGDWYISEANRITELIYEPDPQVFIPTFREDPFMPVLREDPYDINVERTIYYDSQGTYHVIEEVKEPIRYFNPYGEFNPYGYPFGKSYAEGIASHAIGYYSIPIASQRFWSEKESENLIEEDPEVIL
jgi:hypothetical protein